MKRFGTNSLGLLVPNLKFASIQQDVLSFPGFRRRKPGEGKSGQQRAPDFREEDVRKGIEAGKKITAPVRRGKGEKVR
jgi:hypothetical protein